MLTLLNKRIKEYLNAELLVRFPSTLYKMLSNLIENDEKLLHFFTEQAA